MTGARNDTESSKSAKRLLPRLNFGLKLGILVITFTCIWLASERNRAHKLQQATTSVRRSGGVITFADRFASGGMRFVNPLSVLPDWLTWFSEDYVRRAQRVDFAINRDVLPSVTDEDVVSLGGAPDLRELLLGHNTSVGDDGIRSVSRLHKLEGLDLRNTAITDDGLQAVAKLPNLKWLLLNNTAITDRGIEHLSSLENLQVLALSDTLITDASLASLRGFGQLTHLSLLGTKVSPVGRDNLQRMLPSCRIVQHDERREVARKILDLGGKIDFQPTVSTLPIDVADIHNEFANIQRVVVRSSAFTDDDMAKLKSVTELRSLDVADTSVGDSGIGVVRFFKDLETLAVSNQQISDACVGEIKKLTNLTMVGLRNSRVTDEGLAMLAEMPHLERLYVSSPLITDKGVKCLGNITNLKELQLGGNLAGLEFASLSTLKFLEELSLSNTRINDQSVTGLSTITQLTFLSVGGTDIREAGVRRLKTNLSATRIMYWQNPTSPTQISRPEP